MYTFAYIFIAVLYIFVSSYAILLLVAFQVLVKTFSNPGRTGIDCLWSQSHSGKGAISSTLKRQTGHKSKV